MFECNNYLRRLNYLRNDYSISAKRKRILSGVIWNLLSSKKTVQVKDFNAQRTNTATLANPSCKKIGDSLIGDSEKHLTLIVSSRNKCVKQTCDESKKKFR